MSTISIFVSLVEAWWGTGGYVYCDLDVVMTVSQAPSQLCLYCNNVKIKTRITASKLFASEHRSSCCSWAVVLNIYPPNITMFQGNWPLTFLILKCHFILLNICVIIIWILEKCAKVTSYHQNLISDCNHPVNITLEYVTSFTILDALFFLFTNRNFPDPFLHFPLINKITLVNLIKLSLILKPITTKPLPGDVSLVLFLILYFSLFHFSIMLCFVHTFICIILISHPLCHCISTCICFVCAVICLHEVFVICSLF